MNEAKPGAGLQLHLCERAECGAVAQQQAHVAEIGDVALLAAGDALRVVCRNLEHAHHLAFGPQAARLLHVRGIVV